MKTIKTVLYRGFKITVEKDNADLICYSAFITPISQSAKKITTSTKGIRINIIPDYTGWLSCRDAIIDKKSVIRALYKCKNYRFHFWSFGVD